MTSNTLVIGVGNEYRHDDAVGLVVARRLREKNLQNVIVLEMSGTGAELIEAWRGAEKVILIDAAHSGAEPGKVFRFEAHHQSIPTEFFHYSTHALSVAEAIELARTLGHLPPHIIVYGIEGKDFTMGTGLSPEVEQAALTVLSRIYAELS